MCFTLKGDTMQDKLKRAVQSLLVALIATALFNEVYLWIVN